MTKQRKHIRKSKKGKKFVAGSRKLKNFKIRFVAKFDVFRNWNIPNDPYENGPEDEAEKVTREAMEKIFGKDYTKFKNKKTEWSEYDNVYFVEYAKTIKLKAANSNEAREKAIKELGLKNWDSLINSSYNSWLSLLPKDSDINDLEFYDEVFTFNLKELEWEEK
jgi:hypothetical protein